MSAPLSLAGILAEPARRRPDHLAVIEGPHRRTFADLWREARAVAGALLVRGIAPGDRVALMCPNTVDFPRAYFGILAAGATVVPVHLLLTAGEAAHVLRDSGARLLICHEQVGRVGRAAAADAGIDCLGPGDLCGEPIAAFVTRDPLDTAVVFYTSGTTGTPKGAELSHLNMVLCATVNSFDANKVHRDDIALGALPLFHVFGQTVSMNSHWRVGATLVLQPRFDAHRPPRSTNRPSAPVRAPSGIPCGVSTSRSPIRPSRTGSCCCPPGSPARSWSVATTCSAGTPATPRPPPGP